MTRKGLPARGRGPGRVQPGEFIFGCAMRFGAGVGCVNH